MKLIEQKNFIIIRLEDSDYKNGTFLKLKQIFGFAPGSIPTSQKHLLDPILFGPFSEREIQEGEEQFQQFMNQFDPELCYI